MQRIVRNFQRYFPRGSLKPWAHPPLSLFILKITDLPSQDLRPSWEDNFQANCLCLERKGTHRQQISSASVYIGTFAKIALDCVITAFCGWTNTHFLNYFPEETCKYLNIKRLLLQDPISTYTDHYGIPRLLKQKSRPTLATDLVCDLPFIYQTPY